MSTSGRMTKQTVYKCMEYYCAARKETYKEYRKTQEEIYKLMQNEENQKNNTQNSDNSIQKTIRV